jgi:hypothetical protein
MHGFVACDDSADASGPMEQARKADGRGQQGGNSVQDMLRWRPLKTVGQRWSAAKHAVSFLSAYVIVKVYRKTMIYVVGINWRDTFFSLPNNQPTERSTESPFGAS